MNKKTLFFVLLSLVFGVGAVFIAQNWLEENKPEDLRAGQITVYSVNTELPAGTLLDQKYIVSVVMPKEMLAKGTITDKKQLQDMVVKQKLFVGDILKQQRLVKKGEGSTLASLLGKNKRAISIRVNDVVGVSGFLLPGNRVDVLNTYSKGKRATTDVILSNIKIIAIDQRASNDENKPQLVRAVTLEVDLEQAEILMNARNKGSINLALRNPNDNSDTGNYVAEDINDVENISVFTDSEPVNDIVLASASPEKSKPKLYKRRDKIEIIRGVKQESVQVSIDQELIEITEQ
ncbi:MAG: Flp pilus assembly protein CpaB [Psychromonas sp.]